MAQPTQSSVLLDLPAVAGRSALRAGLMAMRVVPTALPTDRRGRDAVLHGLADRPHVVAFVDISHGGTSMAPTLLQLDATLPRDASRQRIVLTRLAAGTGLGHVSDADRRWVQRLGFADLVPEFDALDCEGHLRAALDLVARTAGVTPLTPAELARYARVMNDDSAPASPRARIRALCGLSAEDLAALLNLSLDIADRNYRLQRYPQCFVGSEAVDWMAHHVQRSAPEAVALGQSLMALGLIVHVAHEHPFLDARLYYRLAVSSAADVLDLGQVLAQLMGTDGVPIADRSYMGKTYPRCWIGTDAVDNLVARHRLQRHDAWVTLHRLLQFGLIEHVTHARSFIDGPFYYRFAGLPPDSDER